MANISNLLGSHPMIILIVLICTVAIGFLLWFIIGKWAHKDDDKDTENIESDNEKTIYQRGKDISVQVNQAKDADSGKFYNSKLRIVFTTVISLLVVGLMIGAFLLIVINN